jgi:REP element-mobilizing transposase RayT
MADVYSQLYIHLIFSVKNRNALIDEKFEDEIYKYITGIITQQNHKLIAINGMPDHINILIGYSPNSNLSDLVKQIKVSSTKFINEKRFSKYKFNWQSGYGAFSYSKSQLNNIIKYINTQKEHHKKVSFKDEYITFLKKFEIEYKTEYLFEWIE